MLNTGYWILASLLLALPVHSRYPDYTMHLIRRNQLLLCVFAFVQFGVPCLLAETPAADPSNSALTAETILKKYIDQGVLDADDLDQVIAQLGHERASVRREGRIRAENLNRAALTELIERLKLTDDPELEYTAQRLKPFLKTRPAGPDIRTFHILRKAIGGDGYVQGELSLMFAAAAGGLSTNLAEAVRWATKSSEQDHPVGHYSLGCLYDAGRGVGKDKLKARALFTRSADGLAALSKKLSNEKSEYDAIARAGVSRASDYSRALKHYMELAVGRRDWCLNGHTKWRKRYLARIASGNQGSCNNLAWQYATCSDPRCYDAEKALKYARLACEHDRNTHTVDTLAAAFARNRMFDEAVKTQLEAIDLLRKSNNEKYKTAEMPRAEKRLELYRQRQPTVEGIPFPK